MSAYLEYLTTYFPYIFLIEYVSQGKKLVKHTPLDSI